MTDADVIARLAATPEKPRTQWILNDIGDPFCTRDHVAQCYGAAVFYDSNGVDWARVDAAIVDRWSLSALRYVKREAWKNVARRKAARHKVERDRQP